jgi:DNA-binding transcriptional MocR family regulator
MLLKSPWKPRLAPTKASPSDRLVAALADDIVDGSVATGARLPPQRDLADALGIGLGTVTKAYTVLERRGLIRNERGRGAFVSYREARTGPVIDLSVNIPSGLLSETTLARTLVALSRRIDPGLLNRYAPIHGHDEHQRQMARWLATVGMVTDPAKLFLCNGAHQALTVAFSLTCPAGGTIVTEPVTYAGAIALARQARHRLVAVRMDKHGLSPEALDKGLRTLRTRAKRPGPVVLYVTPTLHNPTTTTMPLQRRHDIVSVCTKHDVIIVEDDVYAFCETANLPPLAMLAPERTFYVNSLSKTLSPGLRIGALVVPEGFLDRAEVAFRATWLMVSALSGAVMGQWLTDGTAESMRSSLRDEAVRRSTLAHSTLGDACYDSGNHALHVWLPMSRDDAARVASACASAGVIVRSPHALTVDPKATESGIRLGLGPPSLPDVTEALTRIASILAHLKREPRAGGVAV